MLRAFLLLGLLPATIGLAAAQDAKPRVPAGGDPGGVAVALISTGIDYTLPALARRLARDGEGEIIGWDIVDKDNRPFDRSKGGAPVNWGGDGTATAGALLGDGAGVRLVAVRVNPAEPVTLARAVAFIAQTPARIAVLAMWSGQREDWEPFRQAASHFKDVLLIVPAGEGAEAAYPAALGLDNILAVQAAGPGAESAGFGGAVQRVPGPASAAAAAAKAAALVLAREPRLDAADLKRRLAESEGGPHWRPRK